MHFVNEVRIGFSPWLSLLFQVLVYLKGFTEGDRIRLARCIAMWMSDSLLDPKVLATLLQDHLIKDGLAADFLCEVSWQILGQPKCMPVLLF